MKAAGYVGAIVQAVTGANGASYARQQLETLRSNDLRIQGYVWCHAGTSVDSMTERLSMFTGYALEALWLDVEESGLQPSDVGRDLFVCDTYIGGLTGIYTGKWFWDERGWSGHWWADRPLWTSYYDGNPDVDAGFVPYGGWAQAQIKQFSGTSIIGSVQQVDLNVMRGN